MSYWERTTTLFKVLSLVCTLVIAYFGIVNDSEAASEEDYYAMDPYVADRPNVDLIAPGGSTLTFNTDSMTLSASGFGVMPFGTFSDPQWIKNINGVVVYYFRFVQIDSGVSIDVTGTCPISISADRDMYIASSFNVSGSMPGRSGGGAGGQGGNGGNGDVGGSG
ncbi:MAG TPA: hypothetical protein PLI09_23175, partial [Candidatus Hydrogenedentes bacterium]|nr:hypothetical protein [Candidatus Hydrogenedentota bacterium]